MPCCDPDPHFPRTRAEYESVNSSVNVDYLKEYERVEAIACALINEIKRQPNSTEIINNAATNGKVDVISFYKKHIGHDEKRMMDLLKPLSQHEVDLLKRMLNN